jgi:hypothetical protein
VQRKWACSTDWKQAWYVEGRDFPTEPNVSGYENQVVSSALRRLGVVEGILLPHGLKEPTLAKASALFEMTEFQVAQAEMQLKYAEGIVMKHGAPLPPVSAPPVMPSKMNQFEACA